MYLALKLFLRKILQSCVCDSIQLMSKQKVRVKGPLLAFFRALDVSEKAFAVPFFAAGLYAPTANSVAVVNYLHIKHPEVSLPVVSKCFLFVVVVYFIPTLFSWS